MKWHCISCAIRSGSTPISVYHISILYQYIVSILVYCISILLVYQYISILVYTILVCHIILVYIILYQYISILVYQYIIFAYYISICISILVYQYISALVYCISVLYWYIILVVCLSVVCLFARVIASLPFCQTVCVAWCLPLYRLYRTIICQQTNIVLVCYIGILQQSSVCLFVCLFARVIASLPFCQTVCVAVFLPYPIQHYTIL